LLIPGVGKLVLIPVVLILLVIVLFIVNY